MSEVAPPPKPAESRLQTIVADLVMKPWFWALFIVLIVAFPIGRALGREVPKPPEMKIPVPAFELTNEQGQPYGLKDLKNKLWVADFVFTSCPTVCPKITKRMHEVMRRAKNLGEYYHLVTFTVDPENDTPQKLAEYGHAYKADPLRWTFLTGNLGELETTVVKGFKMAMGKEASEDSGMMSIFHSEKLVLVDDAGNIRGYYDADDAGVNLLLRDMSILANVR